jgi:6-phosphofructokinase 1
MPTIERLSDTPYRWKISSTPLSRVANVEKKMPKKFISADGFGITPSCERYLKPLIKGEAYPPYKDGLPKYVVLKNKLVTKKIPTDFKLK